MHNVLPFAIIVGCSWCAASLPIGLFLCRFITRGQHRDD